MEDGGGDIENQYYKAKCKLPEFCAGTQLMISVERG
jgi:hypothetical protein